jgi:PAS domain S-box-containing protein
VVVKAFKVGDGLGMVVTDITERKRIEEELKKAYDELENRVRKRTRELSAANIELREEVAERQRAEEKLKASEEKYKTLVETSRDIIFTVDLKGNFLFTNQAFEKLLGYTAEEVKGLNGFELVHPEDSKAVTQQFARLVKGESVDNMEYRYRRKDGSYISILNSASPVFDSTGKVVAAFGVARDITRRKQAERTVQESELWMRNMFNSLNEAVFVVTPDRALANMNQAAERMFGYARDELVDLSAEVLHVDHQHFMEFGRRIKEAFDKEEPASFEFEVKRKNGEIFPSEHTISPLKNDIGESLGIVSVVRDVTERRRAEQELSGYRDHLEELVAGRTSELERANERLQKEITERKWAEEALKAEKEFTERALNAQTDTFFVFEPSTGRAVRWNKTFNQTSGYSDEEIRSMKAPDSYYGEEDLKKAAAAAGKILREGIVTVELSLITKDGRSIPTEYTGSAVADDEGNPKYIIAVGRDITERKRAQDELRKSKELFEKSFNSQQDAMFILDAKIPPTIVDCNPAATKTFGFARQEMLGRTTAFLHVDEAGLREFQARVYPAIEKQGFAYLPEFQMRRKNGAIIQTEHAVTPLTDQQGRRIGWVSVVRDITERKRADEELRKRTYDLGERIKELNCLYNIGKLIETPGMSLEQIFRGTVDLIPPAWQYPEITCARLVLGDWVFATGNFRETIWKQASDIIVHRDREGSLEVYYLEERPQRDEGPFAAEERILLKTIVERLGRVIERKRAEEEIQKLNRSLEMKAAELAAANKELEAFSYSASHDLRAPLRTIDSFSRALLEDYPDKLDQTGKDYLRRVRSATQRMGELIDDLLNLSLTMRREMRREETNLSELARTIAGELQKTKPGRRVDFVIQDRVSAQGDARLLRELLENLLGNAWKFSGKKPQARIEFGVEPQGDRRVYFVRDNGAGFDMNYAEKLFVPFQRLHSDSEFSGNGIGLALAGRIVNRHGGRIWAEGEVEKGATFYFTLE